MKEIGTLKGTVSRPLKCTSPFWVRCFAKSTRLFSCDLIISLGNNIWYINQYARKNFLGPIGSHRVPSSERSGRSARGPLTFFVKRCGTKPHGPKSSTILARTWGPWRSVSRRNDHVHTLTCMVLIYFFFEI